MSMKVLISHGLNSKCPRSEGNTKPKRGRICTRNVFEHSPKILNMRTFRLTESIHARHCALLVLSEKFFSFASSRYFLDFTAFCNNFGMQLPYNSRDNKVAKLYLINTHEHNDKRRDRVFLSKNSAQKGKSPSVSSSTS